MDDDNARVLFVDDEPNLLAAVVRTLRTSPFEIKTAPDGTAALCMLAEDGPFAAIVSDLRMPGMDGVTLLESAREMAPDTVRLLLTGQADLDSAIAAINEGCIFRFLTKPCPLAVLETTLQAAANQYRLVTSERVLLEQTLHGSIEALTDILSLVNPAAFGRATRLRQSVSALVSCFGLRNQWHIEVAAMLSQIGCVILPPATLEKVYQGEPLCDSERAMVERMPGVAEQVLGNIPRLGPVLEILRYQYKNYDGTGRPYDQLAGEAIPWGARALRVALDLDLLESQDDSTALHFDTLRGRDGCYDPVLLEALAKIRKSAQKLEVREVTLKNLRDGMILAQDVKTRRGLLLVARGQQVTPSLIERLGNFSPSPGVQEPIRVVVRELSGQNTPLQ